MEFLIDCGSIGIFIASLLNAVVLPLGLIAASKISLTGLSFGMGTFAAIPIKEWWVAVKEWWSDFINPFLELLVDYGYIGVFIASFLAATILPFSSEAVLSGVLWAGAATWPCFFAATAGNFLGGMSCYWLGMLGKREWIEKYLKLDPVKLDKVQEWIKNKGSWMAFFVFLPGIGDFIAVALGYLRGNIWIVAISMLAGKAIRYWVWIEFTFKI